MWPKHVSKNMFQTTIFEQLFSNNHILNTITKHIVFFFEHYVLSWQTKRALNLHSQRFKLLSQRFNLHSQRFKPHSRRFKLHSQRFSTVLKCCFSSWPICRRFSMILDGFEVLLQLSTHSSPILDDLNPFVADSKPFVADLDPFAMVLKFYFSSHCRRFKPILDHSRRFEPIRSCFGPFATNSSPPIRTFRDDLDSVRFFIFVFIYFIFNEFIFYLFVFIYFLVWINEFISSPI